MSDVLDHPIPTDAPPADFADAIARAEHGKERVLLLRDGKPVAALVPMEDIEAQEALEDAEDSRLAAEALAEYERSGKDWPTHTLEELAARWGIDLAAVDQEPDVVDYAMQYDATPVEFAEAILRVEHGKERVPLTRDGQTVAAMVPMDEFQALERF